MKLRFGVGILVLAVSAAWGQSAARPRTVIIGTGGGSYLGIGVAEVTPERAKALNLKEERGAEVTNVKEDSPASKAGIKAGDVVLEYNGQPVQGTEQLTRMVKETPVGRQVKVVVWRNGAAQTLTATIAESKGAMALGPGGNVITIPEIRIPQMAVPRMVMPPMDIPQFTMTWQNRVLGIMGEALGQETQFAEFFGVKEGVLVKSVNKSSAAEKAGIKAGDVIVKIDDSQVTSTEDIRRVLGRDNKTDFTVTVVRNKKEMSLPVTVEPRTGGGIRAWVRTVNC